MTAVQSETSDHSEHLHDTAPAADPAPRRSYPWGLLTSLAVLWLLFLAYTLEAFTLPWAAHNGYIGAGQFPRIVGCGGLLTTMLAMVLAVRQGGRTAIEVPPGERLRLSHPAVTITLASVLLVVFLNLLGGLIAGTVYLYVCLEVLNRGRHVANGFIAVGFMGVSYVLMYTLLRAPWPIGFLGI